MAIQKYSVENPKVQWIEDEVALDLICLFPFPKILMVTIKRKREGKDDKDEEIRGLKEEIHLFTRRKGKCCL